MSRKTELKKQFSSLSSKAGKWKPRRRLKPQAQVWLIIVLVNTILLSYAFYQNQKTGLIRKDPLQLSSVMYKLEDGTYASGEVKDGESTYYFDPDTGLMVTGFQKDDQGTRYFDASGKMLTGLQTIDENVYYFDQNGYMYQDRALAQGPGKVRYFDKNGQMATGNQTVDTVKLSFDADGYLQFSPGDLQQALEDVFSQYQGTFSVYFKDLHTGQSFSIDDQAFYPCCMIKVPTLMACFQAIDAGTMDFESNANDLEQMIINSSNVAYNRLLTVLGGGSGYTGLNTVNSLLASLGTTQTAVHHGLLPGEGYFTDGGSNVASPVDLGIIFETIYNGTGFSNESQKQMLEYLKNCGDIFALAQDIPESLSFAHKTGCYNNYYHDGGIMFSPGGDYIFVIFTDNDYPGTMDSLMKDVMDTVLKYRLEDKLDPTETTKQNSKVSATQES